jgi:glutathione synthase/RimK-type ligase-like ATP-grasp enzyme
MIILCGIPSETPVAMVAEQLHRMSIPYVLFNQRRFEDTEMRLAISAGNIMGHIELDGGSYRLEDIAGIYLRLMDDRLLPELKDEPQDSPKRRYCRSLHDLLVRWCEMTPSRVVNRSSAMSSNFSKPYQAQLIRKYGFSIPETLITNDPNIAADFYKKHDRVIYKSISGIRSIVNTFQAEDLKKLNKIIWCPVQFQEFVEGIDVRVHVVDSKVFGTALKSEATDYRYAHQQGFTTELREIDVPENIATACINLTRSLGLVFSGIDLRITTNGQVYCFEINPSPAFSYYEVNTGQPIARAVATYLAGLA